MSDYIPVYQPAESFTLTTSAAVTGGQLLESSGSGTVGPAGATSVKVIGVAAFDAASGARVTVFPLDCLHEVTASGTVTAGDPVKAAATGQLMTYVTGTDAVTALLGTAVTTATNGNLVRFLGR